MSLVFCKDCGGQLAPSTPRIVIGDEYVCGDCAYKRWQKERQK